MNRFLRGSLAIIAVLSLLVLISACDKGEKEKTGNFNATGMPIVNEKITLKAMAMKIPMHANFDDMDFTKIMEEKTNIHIEWQTVPLGQEVADKKALAFASGNMPDMFFIVSYMTNMDIATYGPTGLIEPLNELIDLYAPNIRSLFDQYPELKSNITFEDGNIYSLSQANDLTKNHGNYQKKLYINRKWLDYLGLEVPKTTDDLYQVLKAFKAGDPNGNGLPDEIPFSSVNIDPGMMGPWGLSYWWDMDLMMIKDDRTVSYVPTDPAFKQGLQYWNKLFAEELLDNDVVSMTEATFRQKLSTPDAVVGCFSSFADFLEYGFDRARDYEMMPPLTGPQGLKKYTYNNRNNFPSNYFVLSSTCKNKEAAIRWIDYLYTEEGSMLAWNGPDGKMYTYQEDGKIKDTSNEQVPLDDKGNQMDFNAWRYSMTPGYILPYYMSQKISDRYMEMEEIEMSEQQIVGEKLNELSYEYYDPAKPKYSMPSILFSKEDIFRLNELGSQVHSIFYTYYVQFITGEASIDTQWDTYVEGAKQLGVEEMEQIYQKYIDKIYPPGN